LEEHDTIVEEIGASSPQMYDEGQLEIPADTIIPIEINSL
jgi:hypothetical protein